MIVGDAFLKAVAMTRSLNASTGESSSTDLSEVPDKVRQTAAMLASNAAHLARHLHGAAYPGVAAQ